MQVLKKSALLILGASLLSFSLPLYSAEAEAQLTTKELMNGIMTPMTTIIWGAYQLQTDAEWKEIGRASCRERV